MFEKIGRYGTSLDVARNFPDMRRTVKIKVSDNDKDVFAFVYSLEKEKFLEFSKGKDIVDLSVVNC